MNGRFKRGLILSVSPTVLALATLSITAGGISVQAQEEQKSGPVRLPAVKVGGEETGEGYKTERVSSPKATAPLLDTPQTITVIPRDVVEEQFSLSLTEALRNVPGITLQVGEGGAGSGDFIRIRGFDAANDITVDGFSDSLQYSRSDLFNVEAIEVTKGPNSSYGGAGNAAGTINVVSKSPRLDSFVRGTAAGGTNDLVRFTSDVNVPIESLDSAAFRVNFMMHDQDVADRDEIFKKRWGVAPSLALGIDGPTRVTLSAFYQEDDNLIDYGIPFLLDGTELPIARSNYYGVANYDTEQQDVLLLTAKIEHDFSDNLTLANQTRFGEVNRYAIWSTPQNRNTVGDPGQCAPNPDCTFDSAAQAIREGRFEDAIFRTAGPQGIGRDVTTRLLANQTNLTGVADTGAVRHSYSIGMELSREKFYRDGIRAAGLSGRLVNLYDPDPTFDGPVTLERTPGVAENTIKSFSLHAFDTMDLSEQWKFFGGLRWEHYKADLISDVGAPTQTEADFSDDLFTFQAGIIFKPVENGSLYLSYADSKEPPTIAATGTGSGATTVSNEPQKSRNIEAGVKWEVIDRRLAINAALFRTERTNEAIDDDGDETTVDVFDGKRRVQGVELSATGSITDSWSIFTAYTYMDTKIVRADFGSDAEGQSIAFSPPHSFNVWTTYEVVPGLVLGGGAQYFGKRKGNDTADWEFSSYWLLNAMASYEVSKNFELQLNVNNITDELYYERPRVSGSYAFAVPGEGRHAILSLNYRF